MSVTEIRRARVLSVDLVSGEVTAPRAHDEGPPYRHALVLARLHSYPVGFVYVDYPDDLVDRVRTAAWQEYRDEITAHLARDGLAPLEEAKQLAARSSGSCAYVPSAMTVDSAPLVSVIIATLRNHEATLECIDQVLKSAYPNIEIILVDNEPQPSVLKDRIPQKYDERVRYVHQPQQGLSRARNKGLEHVRGELVAVTDDDVIVDPLWITHIVGAFRSRPDVACVTGAILAAELETPAQAWLEQYGGFNKGFVRQVFNNSDNRRPGPLYPFDSGRFGSGANLAFRTDALRSLGGFADDLGAGTLAHGGEDIDILRHVITAGHTLIYEPGALLWHLHRRSYAALRRQLFRYGVGLSATVTKWLLEDRSTAVAVAKRLGAGAKHVLHSDSAKNAAKNADYPSQLTRLELLGLAYGPIAYVRSRRANRRH